jgi:O-antigen/teichoic acid export membrane protein
VKSSRVTLVWALPFCAGLIVFAPDLVEHVLGDEWEPAVILVQGLAGAAAIQQVGYGWFSFYRARGESRPQAVESAAMVAAFLGLAVPGLFLWGPEGFVAGRLATSLAMLAVRRRYVRRLFGDLELVAIAARGAVPAGAAVAVAVALRVGLDPGTLPEAAAFGIVFAALTWALERDLLRELLEYVRADAPARVP